MNKAILQDCLKLFRQPTLTGVEIAALLDLIPLPSILVDLHLQKIIAVNSKMIELTAFTRAELMSIRLDQLIEDWKTKAQQETQKFPQEQVALIKTRSGIGIEVVLNVYLLGTTPKKYLLTFKPVILHQIEIEERQRQVHLLDDLHALISSTLEIDIELSINSFLEIGKKITGASILAIYLADAQSPGFQCMASLGNMEYLPKRISAEESRDYFDAHLWMPGKRVTNNLQRAARAANLAYLATVPLGQARDFLGLIAIADFQPKLASDGLKLLKILASITTVVIQHHIQTSNLMENVKKQKELLAIHETIKDNVQDGLIIVDLNLRIVEMNSSAEWILGYASKEVYGQPVDNIIIGAENLITVLQAAQQGIETPNLGELRLHRRDGSTFSARLQVMPVNAHEQTHAILIILHDLSEQEQYKTRTQQLEHRAILGEFNAIFAHEVRNPINNISTGLQLIALNLSPDDPNQKIISELRQDCQRLSHLMQSALAFSRATEYQMQVVDVSELLQRLIDRWRPRLARENIQSNIVISCDKPYILADPPHIERVFINLISNAVDAMKNQGGRLSINIQKSKDQIGRDMVEVSVCDDGIGIPQENLKHIFEPYFTTSRNGTGLGLAIVKRIVTDHKGTIQVSSIPGGTVFKVTLPEAPSSLTQMDDNG